ncbi:hypothetical protein [Nocardioides nitrophenolicus]|uniref:hypothetical protein n=1 Tax=Nocardioides nitrophenolicus TaxID=60489 RepID=UPI000AB38A3B|nr:hypothetical protein [Nocardioides nitrophenolicus]MBM7519684.1 hypothetical protein [Nocardioides nitrophenolicus]
MTGAERLTALQVEVAETFFALEEAEGYLVAGGAQGPSFVTTPVLLVRDDSGKEHLSPSASSRSEVSELAATVGE